MHPPNRPAAILDVIEARNFLVRTVGHGRASRIARMMATSVCGQSH